MGDQRRCEWLFKHALGRPLGDIVFHARLMLFTAHFCDPHTDHGSTLGPAVNINTVFGPVKYANTIVDIPQTIACMLLVPAIKLPTKQFHAFARDPDPVILCRNDDAVVVFRSREDDPIIGPSGINAYERNSFR